MNWNKPELTKADLQKLQNAKKSDYQRWLDEQGRTLHSCTVRSWDEQKERFLNVKNPSRAKKRSTASLDFAEGRRGWLDHEMRNKRFVSNPKWTWGAFNALCEYVENNQWSYFMTLTAKHKLTSRSARRVAEKFGEHWAKECEPFLDDKSKKGFEMFWVTEEHKNHGMHIHLVLRLPTELERCGREVWLELVRTAQKAVGGRQWHNNKGEKGWWHRVDCQQYDPERGDGYLTKYLTKGVNDWDFFCILEGRNEDWWRF